MLDKFVVKDSGKREEYDSGMRRDTQEGKPRFDLLDLDMLTRWAVHMAKGAVKYGEENWRKANSATEAARFRASAMRHMFQWVRGDTDEDHASAIFFNVAAYEYVKNRLTEVKEDGIIDTDEKRFARRAVAALRSGTIVRE